MNQKISANFAKELYKNTINPKKQVSNTTLNKLMKESDFQYAIKTFSKKSGFDAYVKNSNKIKPIGQSL